MAGEWLSQLPEDLRTNEALTGYATLGDFAKSHLETEGKVKEFDGKVKDLDGKVTDLTGKLSNSIPKLSEKATPEEKNAFYTALGKPGKPEEYELPKPETGEADPQVVSWAQKTFHAANLTKEQAALIGGEWNSFIAGMAKATKEKYDTFRTEAETKLKTEWGADFDKNVELAKRAFKKFGDADLETFFKEDLKGPLGNHPTLIKLLVAVGKAMGDDGSPQGSPNRGVGEVKAEIVYPDMPKK